ncbi:unnamed protein product [Lactuca virosa]|uniref:Uncharacterized protein n=1 Tax=Lactuca virosa TaxID=75947 RepID=A0AAU9PAW9_9ASTR|nr:unnamed protein product [Lactuca virosa]
MQTSHLPAAPTGVVSPAVEDLIVTPGLFQQSSTHQATAAQPVVFQTPPPLNQATAAQPVVFPDTTTAKPDGSCAIGGFPDTTTVKPGDSCSTGGFPNNTTTKPDDRGTTHDFLTTNSTDGGGSANGSPNATTRPTGEKPNNDFPDKPVFSKHLFSLYDPALPTDHT